MDKKESKKDFVPEHSTYNENDFMRYDSYPSEKEVRRENYKRKRRK